ncbi:hypothetical protein F3Y22_tig00110503pilonHSYRG00817 [Hibiscus syriacus]|uniref:CCHC-type domain-containing protein n=1 Tax=Hibiscus syriacus TaxID=106335 RepID=A0A6A3AC81_HIBSY|nr:hypothetical protein F3Y22_tig00110503pilonHSYRG00817 [Hibiscus syriacus]
MEEDNNGMEIQSNEHIIGEEVRQQEKQSYANAVIGQAMNTIDVVSLQAMDEVVVLDGECIMDNNGPYPVIQFADQVHDRIDHSMRRSVIIRLLGRAIGYKTLLNRIGLLWQLQGQYQVIDLENEYFLVKFECEQDYIHVLTEGPWTIFGSYLTVQPWSRTFSTMEKHPSQVIVWVRLPGLPYRYYSKAIYRTDGFWQKIEYEGLQQICFQCGVYGHSKESCGAVEANTSKVGAENSTSTERDQVLGVENNNFERNSTTITEEVVAETHKKRPQVTTTETRRGSSSRTDTRAKGNELQSRGETEVGASSLGHPVGSVNAGNNRTFQQVNVVAMEDGEIPQVTAHHNAFIGGNHAATQQGGFSSNVREKGMDEEIPPAVEQSVMLTEEVSPPDSENTNPNIPHLCESSSGETTLSMETSYEPCSRVGSDHYPLLLQIQNISRIHGIRPFRFITAWQDHPQFKSLISEAWNKDVYVLTNINSFKSKATEWNLEVFGHIGRKKKELLARLLGIVKALNVIYSRRLVELHSKLKSELEEVLQNEESLWFQNSRNQWILQGDKNTKFFHACTMMRRWYNYVGALKTSDGNWVSDQQALCSMVVNFYKELFTSTNDYEIGYSVQGCFPVISDCKLSNLTRPLFTEEIRDVLFSMSPLKAPGVDGLHIFFYQSNWDIVVHSMRLKKGRINYMAIKIDLEKAYDRLEWSFIEETLRELHIPESLRLLIMRCVTSVSTQVLWNDAMSDSFSPTRGLGQGDPLSPYLFVMCMERLSHAISRAVNNGEWKPIRLCRYGPALFHLFFADDLVLFAEKSTIYYSKNVASDLRNSINSAFGFQEVQNLGKYLGVPLLYSRITRASYSYIVSRVRDKLIGWKAKSLSLAGMITLAKAVLSSIPFYSMQSTKLLKGICDEIKRLIRGFIWGRTESGGGVSLVKWETICNPIIKGGLGMKKLSTQNDAFLIKIAYKLVVNPDQLWARVLRTKYKWVDLIPESINRAGNSHLWRGIAHVWQSLAWNIGNGRIVNFWWDDWLSDVGPLEKYIMNQAERANLPNSSVATMVKGHGQWRWEDIIDRVPSDIMHRLVATMPPQQDRRRDTLGWKWSVDRHFSIKSAYELKHECQDDDTHKVEQRIIYFANVKLPWRIFDPEYIDNDSMLVRGRRLSREASSALDLALSLAQSSRLLLNTFDPWIPPPLNWCKRNCGVGLSHAWNLGERQVMVEIDCLEAHIHRDANKVADTLAKLATTRGEVHMVFTSPPMEVVDFVKQEAASCVLTPSF